MISPMPISMGIFICVLLSALFVFHAKLAMHAPKKTMVCLGLIGLACGFFLVNNKGPLGVMFLYFSIWGRQFRQTANSIQNKIDNSKNDDKLNAGYKWAEKMYSQAQENKK